MKCTYSTPKCHFIWDRSTAEATSGLCGYTVHAATAEGNCFSIALLWRLCCIRSSLHVATTANSSCAKQFLISGNIGNKSMQAFSPIPCDTYHRQPVSLLTWQKFSQKQCAAPTRDCQPARVGTPRPGVSCSRGYPSTGPITSWNCRSAARCWCGNTSPPPRVSTMICVAPKPAQACTRLTQSAGLLPAMRTRPSRGRAAGSRPASVAY